MAKNAKVKKSKQMAPQTALTPRTLRLLNTMGLVFSAVGTAMYFLTMYNIAMVCAVLTLAVGLFQIVGSGQRDFGFEIVFIIIGAIVARIFKLNFINTIVGAICIGSLLLHLFTRLGAVKSSAAKNK
ncbi:MAG: hypothetical protein E7430_05395 [Ruminococcaceae bacterium]|nr:hypothetical protein [Oscillospiraceae bacterium]